jgi:hypothetical protein
MRGARGSRRARRAALGAVQRQRQRRLHAPGRQALEDAPVADGREHQRLVADAALGAEQLDRVQHRVQVVRRLAHAHEDDLAHAPQRARQRHLGDDLGAAELALQPADAGHAEQAADRAADLRRHAQAVARQQHGLDGLAVGEVDQQPLAAVGGRVPAAQPRQAGELVGQRRQRLAQRARQEVLERAPPGVLRPRLCPVAQHARLVQRPRAQGAQAIAQGDELHRTLSRAPAAARRGNGRRRR